MKNEEFTDDVRRNFDLLTALKTNFRTHVSGIEISSNKEPRPLDFYCALQLASDCQEALHNFLASHAHEKTKSEDILSQIRTRYDQSVSFAKEAAERKADAVINEVRRCSDLATLVDVSIAAFSERSAQSSLSASLSADTARKDFGITATNVQNAKTGFNKDTFGTYSTSAWVAGGTMAIFTWVVGASFMGGLFFGGISTAIVFGIYHLQKGSAATALREFIKSAEGEFANIRGEMLQLERSAKSKRDDEIHSEEERFRSVQEKLNQEAHRVEGELIAIFNDFAPRAEKWTRENERLFAPISGLQSVQQENPDAAQASVAYSRMGRVHCGGSTVDRPPPSVSSPGSNVSEDKPEVGKIYTGRVVKIMDFGAFVNYFADRDGLVHISQMTWERGSNPTDLVKEGQEVFVKLMGYDDRGKVRLSIKVVDQDTGREIYSPGT